jgi:beta-lactamase superfamily II metal-dependent hydrolase
VTHELHVLDVGHGNCAVIVGDEWAMLVDAAPSAAVVQAIEHLGITRLDVIVISHRDFDHARGLVQLLARETLEIGVVYIGADAAKNPGAPETATLLVALADARTSGRCAVSRDLDDTFASAAISGGGVLVEVLAPTFATAMTGPGGRNAAGGALNSNSVSAVLRVTLPGGLRVLLPGDIDDVALAELVAIGADLSADVLVFPHHGSLGSIPDEQGFSETMMRAVGPHTVLFSVGRAQRARPTEAVLRGVFGVNPRVRLACTQLSRGCVPSDVDLPQAPPTPVHLTNMPAAGRRGCRSCAGSMTLAQDGMRGPSPEDHDAFVDGTVVSPMCLALRPA